ncbi:MAG TPA: chromate transporter [Candidatus Ozemobacteraceae bacterium]|nr:chromate transporter [Candidatus Ozemobacteraceae bacterium]
MASPTRDAEISLQAIFWTFFRVGLFTLGGGLAMATVMRHELVLRKRWYDDREFMAEMATATVVPGAIAVNLAFLQGRRLRGRLGALAAVLGTILPSFSIILLVAWIAAPFFENPKVATFFQGCAVGVGGQLAFAGYAFGRKLLRGPRSLLICSLGLAVVAGLGLHPIWAVVVTGLFGFLLYRPDAAPAPAGQSEGKGA